MKTIRTLFIVMLGSSNYQPLFSQPLQEKIIGKWQLVQTSGGRSGGGFLIKKKTVIEFVSGCRFNKYENDSLRFTSIYDLKKSKQRYSRNGYK